MKASDWIDLVKAYRKWASDYRVAKELGLSRNTISMYRTRTPTMDDETAVAVAQALDIDAGTVVLDQVAERTKNATVREALQEHHLSGPGDVYEPGLTREGVELLEHEAATLSPQEAGRRAYERAGKGRLDITSATAAGGVDPDAAPGAHARTEYASYQCQSWLRRRPESCKQL